MFSLNSTLANGLLTAIVTAADSGSGAALLRVYAGSVPANADTAPSPNTLLAECTCSDPSGTVANKTLTFATITPDSSVNATGTASFFRLVDSAGNTVGQGTVSTTGGSGDLKLDSVSLVSGGILTISSASLSL